MTQTPARHVTGHVGLNVSDVTRAKQFYQDVFGFTASLESQEEGRRFVFLNRDEELVLTLWEQSEGSFAPGQAGLHHLSFQVDSIEDVRNAERRLLDMGARIHHGGIVPHAEGTSSGGLYFEDPDGIRLEIFVASGIPEGQAAPHGPAPTCGFF